MKRSHTSTHLWPQHNVCRFLGPNRYRNSPPRVQKNAVLHESATDCFTLHAPFLLARQIFLWAELVTLSLHRTLEETTLLGRVPAAPVPQLVGRRAGLALRPGGGVGFGLGSGYIVARPVAGMPGTRGVTFGARFQRADAC